MSKDTLLFVGVMLIMVPSLIALIVLGYLNVQELPTRPERLGGDVVVSLFAIGAVLIGLGAFHGS